MAVTPQSNEVVTQNYVRAFSQRGGPSPSNPVYFAGAQEQYLMIGDVSAPIRGNINPINVNDPQRRGGFRRIGTTIDAPDIPSSTITFKQRVGGPPWYNYNIDCPINFYESIGQCADPGDLKNGWQVLSIMSMGLASGRSLKGRAPFDGSEETTADIDFTFMGGVYDIGSIVLGEQAAVQVTTEVVDVVYGGGIACAQCGPANDGTRWLYALQQTAGGSSAVAPLVVYSTDFGRTWTTLAITGIAPGAIVTALVVIGSYLVVLSKSENAYYYASINQLTGVPGAFTKVTTGFVAGKTPNDIYVASANRAYIVGDGGYIYLLSDPTAGVSVLSAAGATTQNLLRINGADQTLYASGASNTILKSTNGGASWAATTSTVTGTIQALGVSNNLTVWVGTASGQVWYTETGGEVWTQSAAFANVTAVQDILWATAEVGYIAATRSGPTAVVFGTFDGGASWSEANTSRFPSAPTYGRPNRLAVPQVAVPGVAANNLAVGGLSGGLVDGVIYVGQAPIQ